MNRWSELATRLRPQLWALLPKRWQWRVLWAANPKFSVGLAAVVTDPQGRVLVLRHAYRTGRQWGLPTGWMRSGETFEEAVAREVREETGLEITVGELLTVESGYALRVELIFHATIADAAQVGPLSHEVLEAAFLTSDELPAGLADTHQRYIAMVVGQTLEGVTP